MGRGEISFAGEISPAVFVSSRHSDSGFAFGFSSVIFSSVSASVRKRGRSSYSRLFFCIHRSALSYHVRASSW